MKKIVSGLVIVGLVLTFTVTSNRSYAVEGTQTLSCRYDGKALNESDIVSPLIQQFFSPELWTEACSISWTESSWKRSARTWCCISYFQMHEGLWRHLAEPDSLESDIGNVRAASALRAKQGNWGDWDGMQNDKHVTATIIIGKTQLNIPQGGLPSTM